MISRFLGSESAGGGEGEFWFCDGRLGCRVLGAGVGGGSELPDGVDNSVSI